MSRQNPETTAAARDAYLARRFFAGSLLLSILLAFSLPLIRSETTTWRVLPFVLLAVWAAVAALATRSMSRRVADSLVVLAILNLLVLVPELGLRIAGFRHESGIDFGYPDARHFQAFEADSSLLWKLAPSEGVNSLGLPGEEIALPKPAPTCRLLFFGDSVTQPGLPRFVEALLNVGAGSGDARFECVNLGVSGYSSHQGRRLAETLGVRLEADLAFVLYGWNDHWLAHGAEDAEKKVRVSSGAAERWGRSLVSRLRVLQAVGRLRPKGSTSATGVRVPRDAYAKNLRAIHAAFAARGIPVVFATAPSAHARSGVPQRLVDAGFARDGASVVELHDRYNEVVRALASEGHAVLDLAAVFATLPDPDLRRCFMSDGIHFTDVGFAVAADAIARFLKRQPALAGIGGGVTTSVGVPAESR